MSTLSHSICLQPLRLLETGGMLRSLYSFIYGLPDDRPAVMTRLFYLLLCLFLFCLLLAAPSLDELTWYCICLCRLPPAFLSPSSNSHPSFLQGVTSCRLSPRLSIVFPVWWPTAFFCPRMHKSGISHDKPSCPKTIYILSDLPVMKRFSFSSHFRAVDIHFPVQS